MYSLILLAGGKGTRMKKDTPKQYLILENKPIIIHSLEKINKLEEIEEVIIVCEKEYQSEIEKYKTNYKLNKKIRYAPAGKTRQESVYNGLKLVKTNNVIIHEAARPFVQVEEFKKLINHKSPNVTYTYPIPFTVSKISNNKISNLLNRSELVNIQLPQKFNTKELLDAHLKSIKDGLEFTEDTSLLYYYTKQEINTLTGTSYNIKITEPIDLIIGEALYKELLNRKEN